MYAKNNNVETPKTKEFTFYNLFDLDVQIHISQLFGDLISFPYYHSVICHGDYIILTRKKHL